MYPSPPFCALSDVVKSLHLAAARMGDQDGLTRRVQQRRSCDSDTAQRCGERAVTSSIATQTAGLRQCLITVD
jgi:hypothetical protein